MYSQAQELVLVKKSNPRLSSHFSQPSQRVKELEWDYLLFMESLMITRAVFISIVKKGKELLVDGDSGGYALAAKQMKSQISDSEGVK